MQKPPKAKILPYSHQSISSQDVQTVQRVLRSGWITQGPKVGEFERKLAEICGVKYAVAVSSGTAGLHIAALALGIGPGDEVITSPNTFVATPNSILYAGGRPVFADIDPETFNLNPRKVESKINSNTKGILPIHFAGHPCDMESLSALAKKRNLFILEDGCHALGAKYQVGSRWHSVGSCAHSDACVFSFHPVKSITTGEGGAVTTNRKDLYEVMLGLRSHGMVKEEERFENPEFAFWSKNGKKLLASWYYEMQNLGFNYRITDFQCALGISQLSKLKSFIRKRREIASFYDRQLGKLDTLILPKEKEGFFSAHHLYAVQLKLEKLSASRAEIFEALRKKGLGVQVHYIPVHLQPYYKKLGFRKGDFPVAETYYEREVSLPLFPSMTSAQIRDVVKKLKETLKTHEI